MSDGVFIRFVAVEYISECNTAVLVALAFLSTVGTRTQSALLKKRAIFTLSAPIRTPLIYMYFLMLNAPICRGKMPSELHQETQWCNA